MNIVHGIITALFLLTLLAVAVIDQKTMEIPDRFHVIILALAVLDSVLGFFLEGDGGILSRVIGFFCVSVPMFLVCLAIEGAFGGGDIKLMAACGAFLGWKMTLVSTFFGIVFGGAWGAYLLIGKKMDKKDHFAFGPFLCGGMAVAVLWGEAILNAYLGLLG